jgi:hypothetical protein
VVWLVVVLLTAVLTLRPAQYSKLQTIDSDELDGLDGGLPAAAVSAGGGGAWLCWVVAACPSVAATDDNRTCNFRDRFENAPAEWRTLGFCACVVLTGVFGARAGGAGGTGGARNQRGAGDHGRCALGGRAAMGLVLVSLWRQADLGAS